MKLKKGRLVWLIISIILLISFIVLSIYQLVNSDFDPFNLLFLILLGDSIFNCFEKEKETN